MSLERESASWKCVVRVTTAPGEAGLLASHEVKGELERGPTVLQPPDAAFAAIITVEMCDRAPPAGPAEAPQPCAPATRSPGGRSHHSYSTSEPDSSGCQQTKSSGKAKPYGCIMCKKKYAHKGTLRNHKCVKQKERTYFCDICKKGFKTKSAVTNHSDTHMRDRRYSCEPCEKFFMTESGLSKHVRHHTLPENRPSCEVCGKRFRFHSDLKRHKHTEDSLFLRHLYKKD